MSKTLVLRPRLSEQTYALAQSRVYVFNVPVDANKHSIARAVAAQFEVGVASVNIANVKGKAKRTLSLTGKRRGLTDGTRRDTKKAYVKLVEGESLSVFAAIEQDEAKEQKTQEQMEKALDKQRQADSKKTSRTSRGAGAVTRMFKKQGDK